VRPAALRFLGCSIVIAESGCTPNLPDDPGGKTLIIAVLGSSEEGRFKDAEKVSEVVIEYLNQ
jgi:hypothetical protein